MNLSFKPYEHVLSEKSSPPTSSKGAMAVDLRDVIYALSDALDLVSINRTGHGKRVGTIAAACARTLGSNETDISTLFYIGMLHDIGVSSTETHNRLIAEFDWDDSKAHCEVGYYLLRDFLPLANAALPVRYHHTHWEKLIFNEDVDSKVAMQANLIFLADRVDALAAPYYGEQSLLMQTERIRDQIKRHANSHFAPELVEAFLEISAAEAFWLHLEPRGIQSAVQFEMRKMFDSHQPYQASIAELKQLARIFARIVDSKSPFTAEHSLGVARLSYFIAERMGICRENCDKLEIAGLLHDLGKLGIPDEILDKPERLNVHERKVINSHSFETFQILRNIEGFEEIASWAAHHHEEPDGSGYPFRVCNTELPLEARILRVADIFQAMVQDRPYRKGMPAEAVIDFLSDLVEKGRIEPDIFRVCKLDLAAAMKAAVPSVYFPTLRAL